MEEAFRVFVVDDDMLMLEMMADLLKEDCQVETFNSAETCLRRLHQLKPDMFLLDISMPGVDGYDLCRILKDKRETTDIPVTFISANDSADARLLGYEAGGEDFITKPFSPDELLLKVQVAQRITANKRALHAQAGSAEQSVAQALSAVSEMGLVVKFLSGIAARHTAVEVGEGLLELLQQLGLEGAVQLRVGGDCISLSPNGRDLPLEVSVLNNVRTAGRIFQFKSRCVFNYEHITLMLNNMPLEDSERCSRIRDNGAALAEGAEARLAAFASTMSREAQGAGGNGHGLQHLRAACEENHRHCNSLMIEYQEQLSRMVSRLGLTDAQENDITDLASDYLRRMQLKQEDSLAALAKAMESGAKH